MQFFHRINKIWLKPCPFGSALKMFALDFVVVIFFKNGKIGGLILSLEKFGLVLY